MELGLGPGDFVLDGDPASYPQKGRSPPPPISGPCLLWPNGWMDQDATWHDMEVGLGPGHIVLDRDPAPLSKRAQSPQFSAHLHIFGASSPDGILPGAKLTLRSRLAFSYIGSVTARHLAAGISQTLRHGTRNGITELSQRAPPIFGWAAITLG